MDYVNKGEPQVSSRESRVASRLALGDQQPSSPTAQRTSAPQSNTRSDSKQIRLSPQRSGRDKRSEKTQTTRTGADLARNLVFKFVSRNFICLWRRCRKRKLLASIRVSNPISAKLASIANSIASKIANANANAKTKTKTKTNPKTPESKPMQMGHKWLRISHFRAAEQFCIFSFLPTVPSRTGSELFGRL